MNKKLRITGFDFARALAILGMVIVNYKLTMGTEYKGSTWMIYLTSIFDGKASAVFVILAGIGISLMTEKARITKSTNLIKKSRQIIWKRSIFLLTLGMFLYLIGWKADILHYYAFYMFISSFYIITSTNTLLYSCISILTISQILQIIFNHVDKSNLLIDGHSPFPKLADILNNLLFNGYHPIFPWICFLLLGMWLGRLNFRLPEVRKKLLLFSLISMIILETFSFLLIKITSPLLGTETADSLFSTTPVPPNIFYILSSSSIAIIVIVLCIYFTEKFAGKIITKILILTGQMSLTYYIGHVFALIIFSYLGLVNDADLLTTLILSLTFYISAMCLSYFWKLYFTRGPIELIMRKYSD
ncbi:DUF418 domain-containing protein [Bacillus clarus]|uniref:DUF418 domain-containing protein n=1 Tax=Bacillus clarus TaxID=2338372 RepID=A0A090YBU2_9BACI|nr:DUF418 domain-containing protein [Bacillus clarus]KFM95611.1 hypothetical protein DJ93_5428 [Bacillus clarus]RFT62420.1 DUF418 domain-containing protein [Bacillus clarus]